MKKHTYEATKLKSMMLTLAEMDSSETPVISTMINLEQTHQQAADDIGLQVAKVSRGLSDEHKKSLKETTELIQNYLKNTALPHAKCAAIYAKAGENGFLFSLPLGISSESSLVVDSLPHLYYLVETKDVYHRFVVVTMTSREAKIFETTAGSITDELLTERPDLREKIGREWTRERYQNHRRDRKQRFVQSKITIVEELMAKRGHNHLILAGSPKMVSEFKNALPLRLQAMLIDVLDYNPKAGVSPILLEAISSFVANEHEESLSHVDDLESAVLTQGLGVAGEEHSAEALEFGNADMLIIDQNYPERSVKEKLIRLALSTGAEIETVRDSEKLNRLGGVGCLLRYKGNFTDSRQIKKSA